MIKRAQTRIEFKKIAIIHQNEINGKDFLSNCSLKVTSKFYETVAKYDDTVLIIKIDNNNDILGFVFITFAAKKYFSRFLLKNWYKILVSPSSYSAFFHSLLKKIFTKDSVNYNTELVHIAVSKANQGKGIAKELILEAIDILKNKIECKQLYLQVTNNNQSAIKLYKKLGFEIFDKIKNSNKIIMVKNIEI